MKNRRDIFGAKKRRFGAETDLHRQPRYAPLLESESLFSVQRGSHDLCPAEQKAFLVIIQTDRQSIVKMYTVQLIEF